MQNDPLVRLERAARALRDADDWDEPTGRTDVHVHLESKPDSDRPPSTWKGWVWKLALLLVAAIGAGVAAALSGKR